jgi:hypothetical protein
MHAAISSKVLKRIKFELIAWTDLTSVASSSIDPFVMYWVKIENIVHKSSSFWSFVLVNKTVPSEQTDRRWYSTSITLLSSRKWKLPLSWLSWCWRQNNKMYGIESLGVRIWKEGKKKLISTGHMLKNMQDKAETTHQANNFYKEVIGSYCCYRS